MTSAPQVDQVTALVLDRIDRLEVSVKADIVKNRTDFEAAIQDQKERIEKIEANQAAHNKSIDAFLNKWKGGAIALAGIGSVISYASGILNPLIKYFSVRL